MRGKHTGKSILVRTLMYVHQIYRAKIELEEMRSGVTSSKPKDLPFYQALEDPPTRVKYIHRTDGQINNCPKLITDFTDLQNLQWRSESFLKALLGSTKKMPYGMRYLARETLHALQTRFPDAPMTAYVACMGRLIFYRYINPAIL
jgi:Ras GTPase-activating-like protein IQGAP2/3